MLRGIFFGKKKGENLYKNVHLVYILCFLFPSFTFAFCFFNNSYLILIGKIERITSNRRCRAFSEGYSALITQREGYDEKLIF
jgi:hypothetical protein